MALKLLKPSKGQLVRLSAYEHSKSSGEYFSPKDIELLFSEYVEKVDHSIVSNSLKKLAKVNVLEKLYENEEIQRKPGKPRKDDRVDKLPGPTSKYTQSENEITLRNFVSRPVPREMIYRHLLNSDVLLEHLKFLHYHIKIRCKYGNVNEIVKSIQAKGPITQESLDEFKSRFLHNQNFWRQKDDKQIMLFATEFAKMDLRQRDWRNDSLYTEFFVDGGRCYPVIEESNV